MFCWDRILRPLGVVFGNSGQSKVRCSRIDCGHPRQASGQFCHNALMTASGTLRPCTTHYAVTHPRQLSQRSHLDVRLSVPGLE